PPHARCDGLPVAHAGRASRSRLRGVPASGGTLYTAGMSDNPATTTDFGFRQVSRAEKAGLVRRVFDSVAPRYDLMNDLMSLGVHRVWKRIFVSDLGPRPQHRLQDLAGGTGDVTFGWLAKGGGSAILSDINASMLAVGRDRALDRGFAGDVTLLVADAEKLPLP